MPYLILIISILLEGSAMTTPQDFGAIANDGKDDTAAFEAMFASGQENITIAPGTYDFIAGNGVNVVLRNNLHIEATGATFVSHQVDGDLFSFDSAFGISPQNLSFSWHGGTLDITDQLNSTVVPWNTIAGYEPKQVGTAATTDAISLRGNAMNYSTGNAGYNVINNVKISDMTIKASDTDWMQAGGDSGLLINAKNATVENSTFIGIRDAAIYFSSDNYGLELGGNYVARNNTVTNSAVGISSKRGADNVLFENNTISNTAVALTIYKVNGDARAENITFKNNIVDSAWIGIKMEQVDGALIAGNKLSNIDADALNGIKSVYGKTLPPIDIIDSTNVVEQDNTIASVPVDPEEQNVAGEWLRGTGQNDLIRGGEGNDRLLGFAGRDLLIGEGGKDMAVYHRSNAGVEVDLSNHTAYGGHAEGDILVSVEDLMGSEHDDILVGDAGKNTLIGRAGDDILIGNGGNDRLVGQKGDDLLIGGDGIDWMYGDLGDDILIGSSGADRLTGGKGSDIFAFLALSDSTFTKRDIILDFEQGEDKIQISGFLDIETMLNQHTNRFDVDAGVSQMRYIKTANGNTRLFFDADGDALLDMDIALKGHYNLDISDFV